MTTLAALTNDLCPIFYVIFYVSYVSMWFKLGQMTKDQFLSGFLSELSV